MFNRPSLPSPRKRRLYALPFLRNTEDEQVYGWLHFQWQHLNVQSIWITTIHDDMAFQKRCFRCILHTTHYNLFESPKNSNKIHNNFRFFMMHFVLHDLCILKLRNEHENMKWAHYEFMANFALHSIWINAECLLIFN